MEATRRDFVAGAVMLGAGLSLTPATARAALLGRARQSAKVLFLGGTGFIGPHIVRQLLDRGHEVTLFNRGNRSDDMFPDVECIVGNRIPSEGPGLEPLAQEIAGGRRWDVVIDTANVHRWTDDSARVMKGAAAQYVYTSSMSVYADNSQPGVDETSPVATMPEDEAAKIDRLPYNMQYFGAVKALSEQAAETHFPGRTTVVRPGLIVGPRDFSHRFTYWPWRVRQGGEVLAPGAPDHPVAFIDARDLAAFLVKLIEDQKMGTYNLTGPTSGDMTIGALLEGCRAATESDATFTWVDGDFLAARGINAWAQMPVWIPPVGPTAGFHRKSIAKAVAAGLTTRPLAETVRDTLTWLDDEYIPRLQELEPPRAYEPGVRAPGITREMEAETLAAWKARDEAGATGTDGGSADG